MKRNILFDILCYVLLPMIICYLINKHNMQYIAVLLVIPAIFYTIIIFKNQRRLNLTGIIFNLIYVFIQFYKLNVESKFMGYVYDTYMLIGILFFMMVLILFKRNIVKRVYVDVLTAINYKKYKIESIIKKGEVNNVFNNIFVVINIHILILIFIRIYTIVNYGADNFNTTFILKALVTILFCMWELYLFFKVFEKITKQTKIKNIKAMQNKVIYMDKYKKTNR